MGRAFRQGAEPGIYAAAGQLFWRGAELHTQHHHRAVRHAFHQLLHAEGEWHGGPGDQSFHPR